MSALWPVARMALQPTGSIRSEESMSKLDHHLSSPAQLQAASALGLSDQLLSAALLPSGLTSIPGRHSYALAVHSDRESVSCRQLLGRIVRPDGGGSWRWPSRLNVAVHAIGRSPDYMSRVRRVGCLSRILQIPMIMRLPVHKRSSYGTTSLSGARLYPTATDSCHRRISPAEAYVSPRRLLAGAEWWSGGRRKSRPGSPS